MTEFQPVNDYEKEKETGLITVYISIIAAIGVNTFVAGFMSTDKSASCIFVILGLLIILCSLIAYYNRKRRLLSRATTLNGFFIYNTACKEILNIPRYDMEERMYIEMRSIREHNPELRTIWNNSELGVYRNISKDGIHIEHIVSEGDRIIKELLEYFVLQGLSSQLVCLSDLGNEEIIKIDRQDIPDLIKTNRILNWLSEEKEDNTKYRDFLIKHNFFDNKPIDLSKEETKELLRVMPKEPYSLFEMYLPKEGTIRKKDNCIVIEHPAFSVSFEIIFNASSALLPRYFKQWYLGIDERDGEHKEYQYGVRIDVKFKWWTILINKYKKYYRWIDHFICRMDDLMSEDTFFHKIGWDTACTVLMCNKNQNKNKKKQKHDEIYETIP